MILLINEKKNVKMKFILENYLQNANKFVRKEKSNEIFMKIISKNMVVKFK